MKGKIKERRFILELDFNEHEISVLQATLGLQNLPELVKKSFPEWEIEEIKNILNEIRDVIK